MDSKKSKSGIGRRVGNFFGKIKTSRVAVRSTVIVLLVFLALILLVSFLAYPQLIYRTVQSAYQNNPSLLNFVRSVDSSVAGFAQAVAPIGLIGATMNNGLVAAAPTIQRLGSGLGNSLASLAGLDNAGKYLVFQNAAAWISVILILFYGEYVRKGYRYKKK
jgi:predicted PurR-regulated permease PerM